MCDIKREMKVRARLTKGLANALQSDADYIYSDVYNFDILCMNESLKEAKETLQKITANIAELEYLLDLTKKEQ
jgi:hypothetical protein